MTNWKEIRKEWEENKTPLSKLADKHSVKLGTLKSRKSREGWGSKDATIQTKKVAKVATREPPEMIVESDDLTEKQKLFCLYYIKYFNATKAYKKAYGCAYLTARVEGHRHLKKPNIFREIKRLKTELQRDEYLTARDVLQKYIDIAFADITDFVEFGMKTETSREVVGEDDEGKLLFEETEYQFNYVDFKNSEEVDGTIITEVKKGKDGVSVKLADKMRALEFLAKYTDLLSESERKRLQEERLAADNVRAAAEHKLKIEKLKVDIDVAKGKVW